MFNISWGLQHISTHPLPFPLYPPYTLFPPYTLPPAIYFGDVTYFPLLSILGRHLFSHHKSLSISGCHLCSHHTITLPVLFRGCRLFPPCRYLFWDVIYVPITPSVPAPSRWLPVDLYTVRWCQVIDHVVARLVYSLHFTIFPPSVVSSILDSEVYIHSMLDSLHSCN